MIWLWASIALISSTQDDAQAKRAATITRLQQVGSYTATAQACSIVGYEPDSEGTDAYWLEEGHFAASEGFFPEQSAQYIKAGMDGRAQAILAEMKRNRQLLDAGDKRADPSSRAFVNMLVDDCDLLASRSETRRMFDYVPPNEAVARAAGLKRLGLTK